MEQIGTQGLIIIIAAAIALITGLIIIIRAVYWEVSDEDDHRWTPDRERFAVVMGLTGGFVLIISSVLVIRLTVAGGGLGALYDLFIQGMFTELFGSFLTVFILFLVEERSTRDKREEALLKELHSLRQMVEADMRMRLNINSTDNDPDSYTAITQVPGDS